MERDWRLRQENVLPLASARNEGRFYGLVMLGRQQLTLVQRIGILLVALPLTGFGLILLMSCLPDWLVGANPRIRGGEFPPGLSTILGIFFSLIVGFRFSWIALRPKRSIANTKEETAVSQSE
jgi:hypothetical protein